MPDAREMDIRARLQAGLEAIRDASRTFPDLEEPDESAITDAESCASRYLDGLRTIQSVIAEARPWGDLGQDCVAVVAATEAALRRLEETAADMHAVIDYHRSLI